jgi:rare lipoprotein A
VGITLAASTVSGPGVLSPVRSPAVAESPLASVTAAKRRVVWITSRMSWYGPGLYGHGTACGKRLTRSLLGVAHKTLPCGTKITFKNPRNGRTITVKVVDRGPYVAGRTWDLTYATCRALGMCHTMSIKWRRP